MHLWIQEKRDFSCPCSSTYKRPVSQTPSLNSSDIDLPLISLKNCSYLKISTPTNPGWLEPATSCSNQNNYEPSQRIRQFEWISRKDDKEMRLIKMLLPLQMVPKVSSPCWENREGRKGLLGNMCGSWAVPHDYLLTSSFQEWTHQLTSKGAEPTPAINHSLVTNTLWLTESKASDRSKISLAKHIIKDLGRSVNDLSSALLSQIQSAVGAHGSAKSGFQGLEINDPLDFFFFIAWRCIFLESLEAFCSSILIHLSIKMWHFHTLGIQALYFFFF